MPMRDPHNYPLMTYIGVLFIACWGGVVNYISRIKNGAVAQFSVPELIGELVISAFSGVLMFWLCESFQVEPLITSVCAGIAGHAGGRMVFILETSFNKRLESLTRKLGAPNKEE